MHVRVHVHAQLGTRTHTLDQTRACTYLHTRFYTLTHAHARTHIYTAYEVLSRLEAVGSTCNKPQFDKNGDRARKISKKTQPSTSFSNGIFIISCLDCKCILTYRVLDRPETTLTFFELMFGFWPFCPDGWVFDFICGELQTVSARAKDFLQFKCDAPAPAASAPPPAGVSTAEVQMLLYNATPATVEIKQPTKVVLRPTNDNATYVLMNGHCPGADIGSTSYHEVALLQTPPCARVRVGWTVHQDPNGDTFGAKESPGWNVGDDAKSWGLQVGVEEKSPYAPQVHDKASSESKLPCVKTGDVIGCFSETVSVTQGGDKVVKLSFALNGQDRVCAFDRVSVPAGTQLRPVLTLGAGTEVACHLFKGGHLHPSGCTPLFGPDSCTHVTVLVKGQYGKHESL